MESRILKKYPNKITQNYNAKKHKGIDIVGSGTNNRSVTDYIVAHSDGIVTKVIKDYKKNDKTGNSYGNYVKIRHNNNYYTLYAHLKYGSVKVNIGDVVNKGDVIGYMGNTGHSTGAHLHFEVRNQKDVRINPKDYINNNLPEGWIIGKYRLIYPKTIRKSCSLIPSNRVFVDECMKSVKPKLTSEKPMDIAIFKSGEVVNIKQIILKDKRVWGKLENCYIVLCNISGEPQAELINE